MKTLRQLYQQYGMILRYLVIGVATTAVNYIVFAALTMTHTPWFWANLTAWLASVIFAFFTNKQIVFQSAYTTKRAFIGEILAFFALRALSLLPDMGIMWLGIDLLHWNTYGVKILDQLVIIVLNYLFSKLIFIRK